MRPKSIARFELLSLLSVALAAIAAFLSLGGDIPGAGGDASGGTAAVAATVIGIVISLVLILLTSRKRSNVARWILVVVVAVGAVMTAPHIGELASDGLAGLADVASLLLQVVAIFLLFTAEARAWFDGSGSADGPRT